MGRIEKDKNLVKFWVDGKAKPYVLDINTSEFYGLRGAPLVNIPNAVVELVYRTEVKTSVLRLVYNKYRPNRNANLYSLADKLDAIGYNASIWELSRLVNYLDIINFKDLANYLKTETGHNVDDYLRDHLKNKWVKDNNLVLDDHFTQDMLDFLYDNFRGNDKETLHRYAYYLARGLWEYHWGNRYDLRDRLREFSKYIVALEIPMEKGDFFRQFINAQRAYNANKNELVNKAIAKQQQKKMSTLLFENDEFMVIVPTTQEELTAEGQAQRNCVGGYGDKIADGWRNVVFIRRKADPNKPYITCDILDDGSINQYLIFANRYPTDERAKAFKSLYQHHLSTHWGE